MNVLLLGAAGMLGFALHRVLNDGGYNVVGTVRSTSPPQVDWCRGLNYIANIDIEDFDAVLEAIQETKATVVINATTVRSVGTPNVSPETLLQVNSVFPQLLGRTAETLGIYFIHFSTDGVFCGLNGMYDESARPDAVDMYGVSKFLGEPSDPNCLVLRTSVLGRGIADGDSLLDWFLTQSGTVRGFRRSVFSGLPANEIAHVLASRVLPRTNPLTGLFHLSSSAINKYALLELIRSAWSMDEIQIEPDDTVVIDRSLNSELLGKALDYTPPSWKDLIADMRSFYSSVDCQAYSQQSPNS